MPLRVRALDHLVLTVADIEATVAFYEALGMTRVRFGEGRVALAFGGQKINLHQAGAEIAPDAAAVFSGADMIVKVKEPQAVERAMLRPGQVLFTCYTETSERLQRGVETLAGAVTIDTGAEPFERTLVIDRITA